MCCQHRKLLPNFPCFLFSLYLSPFATFHHCLLYFLGTLDACLFLTWHPCPHRPHRPLWPSFHIFHHLYFLTLLFLHTTLQNSFPIPQALLPPIGAHIAMLIFVWENA